MVHQSSTYFERCNSADYDLAVANETRRQCWAAWLQNYHQGQPPDRIEYAQQRIRDIEAGIALASLPGMEPPGTRVSYTSAFLATSAPVESTSATAASAADTTNDAIPQGTEGLVPTTDTDDTNAPAAPPPRRQAQLEPPTNSGACAPVCGPRWQQCMRHCEGREAGCERACGTEHRTCMRACH